VKITKQTLRRIIREELELAQVPNARADWDKVAEFAVELRANNHNTNSARQYSRNASLEDSFNHFVEQGDISGYADVWALGDAAFPKGPQS